MTHVGWALGEPNNVFSGEDCAELITEGWNDKDCATKLSWAVCERDR